MGADADKSKTGKLTVAEFDELCENVASLPRRFGLAPSWEQEYGGSMEKRLASRKKNVRCNRYTARPCTWLDWSCHVHQLGDQPCGRQSRRKYRGQVGHWENGRFVPYRRL